MKWEGTNQRRTLEKKGSIMVVLECKWQEVLINTVVVMKGNEGDRLKWVWETSHELEKKRKHTIYVTTLSAAIDCF